MFLSCEEQFLNCGCKGSIFFRISKENVAFFIKKRKKTRFLSLILDICAIFASQFELSMELVETIIQAIQEKKGQRIVVCDLQGLEGAIANYFIICQGSSPAQVEAITESVGDMAREQLGEKPAQVAGLENAQWVAMDYGDVMVHIFLPDVRQYYDLEHLWDDAAVTEVPDLD
ncbi:MAG: ribosome silencing factor [Prevotella sp.]|nr:ribosome silencing factor [Prevotella sp.]